MVAMADPHLGPWTYKHDLAGRLREQTDAKGQRVAFTYNAPLSRLDTKKVYNSAGQLVSTAIYTYDTSDDGNYTVYKGMLYKVTDSEGWEKNGYDTRGRLSKTTRHLNIKNQDYTTTYTYNDGDKTTSIGYPNSGPAINYQYHPSGRLYRVYKPNGYSYYIANAADYDAFGDVTRFYYRNGATATTQTFFPVSQRLQNISASGILSKDYSYNKSADVTYISGVSITYDDLHRIKTYSGLAGSYAYDSVGNITASIEGGGSSYTYGNARKQAVKTAFGKTYLYDECGNMIVRGTQALDYDAENHLTRLSQPGSLIVEYGYAADGTRLWKRKNQVELQVSIGKIYEEKQGKTLFHVWAGNQLVCTFEPGTALAMAGEKGTPGVDVEIARIAGTLANWFAPDKIALGALPFSILGLTLFTGSTTKRSRRFRPAPWWQRLLSFWLILALVSGNAPLVPLPQAHAQTYTPVAYYYYADHLRSSSTLTDANGAVVESNTYLPFGRDQGGNPNAFDVSRQFTGQILDSETGLYYYGARYYDPELARFIQPDTVIPDLANPQSYNRYSYAANNPVKYVDPDGHFFFIPVLLGIGALFYGGTKVWESSTIAASNNQTAVAMDAMVGRSKEHKYANFNEFKVDYKERTNRDYGGTAVSAGSQEQIAAVTSTGKAGAEAYLETTAAVVPGAVRPGGASSIAKAVEKSGVRAAEAAVPSAAKTGTEVVEGTKVYRVWGGKSGPWGESWTTVNPNAVPNFRSAAGLPDVNAGRFVSEGVLKSTEGVTARGALVIKSGQQGNLPELVIKNAEQKIKLLRVSGSNPEF